ncbi:MAG TPA: serine hydrolase domain-containing protein [Acidimicrobiales bacterium]|nr:serine hydrolase domain-containing protein [Acidimicrobiales bacterium]
MTDLAAPTIGGTVEPGFESVRDAFIRNFTEHGELGAGVAVHVDGKKVVDLWGGVADPSTGRPYDDRTLQLVFSTTKGATALCVALLAQRGEIDYDAKVSDYWPEFAAAGKGEIPVRVLMSHRAGIPVIDKTLTTDEVFAWTPLVEALAAQAPVWEPGKKHGYHAVTYGHLAGELVRRISGKSLGTFFADEVAKPLGLDFWIGLPASEESRVAPLVPLPPPPPEMEAMMAQFMGPDSLIGRALLLQGALGALSGDMMFNTRAMHAAEIPAANGITNATSLSRMYAACVSEVDGIRLLTPETVRKVSETLTSGPDQVLMVESTFGLGFMTHSSFTPMMGPSSFGHAGAGGSLGFGDADSGVGFGYVMNQMQMNLAGDPRPAGLIDAVKASL